MPPAPSLKFIGHGARICNLPGTCRYSGMLLKEWTSQWIFKKPTLVVGGGVGRDTMRNMQTVHNRQGTINRIRELVGDTDPSAGDEFKNMSEFSVKNIKHTVRSGGVYVGVCNGAYIAGERVDYKDSSGINIKHGGLGLFPGTTIGPMYDNLPATQTNTNVAGGTAVTVIDPYGQPHTTWYHNGGTFPGIGGQHIDYRIHALYDIDGHDYPAIVSFRYGSGTVILSGIHPEFDGEGMDGTSYRLFDGIFRKLGVVRDSV